MVRDMLSSPGNIHRYGETFPPETAGSALSLETQREYRRREFCSLFGDIWVLSLKRSLAAGIAHSSLYYLYGRRGRVTGTLKYTEPSMRLPCLHVHIGHRTENDQNAGVLQLSKG